MLQEIGKFCRLHKTYLCNMPKRPSSGAEKSITKDEGAKASKQSKLEGENKRFVYEGKVLKNENEVRKRDSEGMIIFPDAKDFHPNMTPKEVLQAGSFGGTYFRPIKSAVTGLKYNKMWNELPQDWLEGLDGKRVVYSSIYDESVNKYKAKCGASLEEWENSGWIVEQDPYGWFMWYCRYYLGRRTQDDERQIGRWKNCCGPKGRWKGNLIGKIARAGAAYNNFAISPVVRQTLQHWGYCLTEKDYKEGKKRVKM